MHTDVMFMGEATEMKAFFTYNNETFNQANAQVGLEVNTGDTSYIVLTWTDPSSKIAWNFLFFANLTKGPQQARVLISQPYSSGPNYQPYTWTCDSCGTVTWIVWPDGYAGDWTVSMSAGNVTDPTGVNNPINVKFDSVSFTVPKDAVYPPASTAEHLRKKLRKMIGGMEQ